MDRFDVAVIGAGVHGVSAAYHLASRGVRTVVFEREAPALGPTGRSSGICRAYYTNPFLARMAWESIGMLRRFEEITGGHDAGFRETGFLFLQRDEHRAQVSEVLGRLTRPPRPTACSAGPWSSGPRPVWAERSPRSRRATTTSSSKPPTGAGRRARAS